MQLLSIMSKIIKSDKIYAAFEYTDSVLSTYHSPHYRVPWLEL